jgi:hypothetical protein
VGVPEPVPEKELPMDRVRYLVALIMVMSLPPLILFWLLIHPFVWFWRRLGSAVTYTVVGSIILAGMGGLYLVRRTLLSIDFGTHYCMLVPAAACLAGAAVLRHLLGRQVSVGLLVGLPELATRDRVGTLVTQGIYAAIRHPRYVQFILALAGYALVANFLASYAAVLLWVAVMPAIVYLEERELRARFGQAYEEYARRVPRFIPRIGKASR